MSRRHPISVLLLALMLLVVPTFCQALCLQQDLAPQSHCPMHPSPEKPAAPDCDSLQLLEHSLQHAEAPVAVVTLDIPLQRLTAVSTTLSTAGHRALPPLPLRI
jgi:hypothetical protein